MCKGTGRAPLLRVITSYSIHYTKLYEGVADQQHLPDKLQGKIFYHPTERGYEKMISERMRYYQELRKTARRKGSETGKAEDEG